MTINKIRLIFVVAIMAFSSQNGCAAYVPPYSTVIRNIGTQKFSDSMVIFNKRKLTAGWVTPGNYKVNEYPSAPIPEKAILHWQREDGVVYDKEIQLKEKLPKLEKNQEYYLIFDIDDNNNALFKVIVCGKDENCLNRW